MTGEPVEWSSEVGDAHPDGVTTLEIADLPDAPRRLLSQMVREQAAHPDGIAFDALPAVDIAGEALEALLARLVQAGWLSVHGEGAMRRFRVRLRSRRVGGGGPLWTALSDISGDEPHS